MYDHIIETLRRGDVATALKEARAAVAATPDDQQAQRMLALAEAFSGNPRVAHQSLDRALALTPQDASLHYLRAALLVAEGREAEAALPLGETVALDPNEIRAYLLQMQLAIGRGDLDEADRLGKLATRLDPDHPRLLVQQALVALHRNDPARAHALLQRAEPRAPGDAQLRYARGLAYRAQGHYAFAEQAFRELVEQRPAAFELRFLLADVIRLQQRYAEAAELLEEGMGGDEVPADALRYAGELWLMAGQHARALPLLQRAAAGQPGDRPTQDALLEALRRNGDADTARNTLDALLATTPREDLLWAARLQHEPTGGDRRAVQARWQAAMPHSIHAMHAGMDLAADAGDADEANTLARRILEEHPGHHGAQVHTIRQLYRTDPAAAVRYIREMLPRVQDQASLRMVRGWLARAQDKAGDTAGALATWRETRRIGQWPPLPPAPVQPLPPGREYPPLPKHDGEPLARPMFAWGAPGSGIEMVVGTLVGNVPTVRNDRLATGLPADPFAQPGTAPGLANGSLDPAETVAAWRRLLPMRQIEDGNIIDWLPQWENAWLHALRAALPEGLLLLALRDPRDTLMDWLANGGYVEYAVDSPVAMAEWLVPRLEQMADLIEGDLYPHRVVRTDGLDEDTEALTHAVAAALGTELAVADVHGPSRLPAGHWRVYRDALGDAFALLAPVAVRLGYPAD